jgi:hypothetical protein
MPNICVFLSANNLEEKYTQPAQHLGKLLAQNGYNFVYGGDDRGLMKVMATSVQENGGKVIAVITPRLKDRTNPEADESIMVQDDCEQTKIMDERSSAIIVMAGGLGTLSEVTRVLVLKKRRQHHKPVIVFNSNEFYTGLIKQLTKMKQEGCLPSKIEELLSFATTPNEVIKQLTSHLA